MIVMDVFFNMPYLYMPWFYTVKAPNENECSSL